MLPESMPAQFQSNYTPIAAAGTEAQIEHLSRLLATQLTAVGMGPGIEEVSKMTILANEESTQNQEDDKAIKSIQTVVGKCCKSLLVCCCLH